MIMANSQNIVLYGSGLFGRNTPGKNAAELAALQASGFTTVILWTLHVDADGTLVYNNTVIARDGVFADTFDYLPGLVDQLTASGSSVQNVLFSIGSGGVNDFTNIKALLATQQGKLTLMRNFSALSSALPISGYDFDDEDLFDSSTIATLSQLLASGNQMIITYCPFSMQSVWNQAVQDVYGWDRDQDPVLGQSVRWWNLQNYSGGAGNDPASWVKALPTNAGIADPAAYIVPGFDASEQDPASIQQTFQQLAGSDPGISGGFIWNSSAIFSGSHTPGDYAQAIIAGLGGGKRA
jgi:hypothetical protein